MKALKLCLIIVAAFLGLANESEGCGTVNLAAVAPGAVYAASVPVLPAVVVRQRVRIRPAVSLRLGRGVGRARIRLR